MALWPLLLAAATNAPSPLDPGLAALSRLAGWCWSGTVAPETVDTHCFTPMFGGTHLRDRHKVRHKGQVIYQGETIFSREGAELSFIYLNSLGGVGRGSAHPLGDGVEFSLTMRARPGDQQVISHFRWLWREGAYAAQQDGGEAKLFSKAGRAEEANLP